MYMVNCACQEPPLPSSILLAVQEGVVDLVVVLALVEDVPQHGPQDQQQGNHEADEPDHPFPLPLHEVTQDHHACNQKHAYNGYEKLPFIDEAPAVVLDSKKRDLCSNTSTGGFSKFCIILKISIFQFSSSVRSVHHSKVQLP